MDKIYLTGMEFYGYHGALPEETKLGQRFRVDLELEVDLREAGAEDALDKTINYAEVFALCRNVVEQEIYKLIEAVAEKLAADILETFPLASAVTVKMIKPDPPIAGHYQSVAVEIKRSRVNG